MRRILAATVLASPFFLSAAAIAAPATDATASTPTRALSTGVKPAHVLSLHDVDLPPTAFQASVPFIFWMARFSVGLKRLIWVTDVTPGRL